ncbi:NAD(P)/FAD-dependent oxidoreductase [Nocardia uniformis]|uniref:NAD(P)/FAD-dependent oxidoreductase n=2 Tax=Nocardia uniformis TaxID=53432 RepID=A0A849C0E8_9NOCA|nr:NAD(P)/FAD-dependent oxidoreductase [Nocardia uniformis]
MPAPALTRLAERHRERTAGLGDPAIPDVEVVLVGAGFGGIGAGVELGRAGFDDYVVIEKHEDLGGTWHINTYPGVAVDIPSIYYSFSYLKPKVWSQMFAPGAEVKAYARQVATHFGVDRHMVFGTTITETVWDEPSQLWHTTTADGITITSRYFVPAVGGIEVPKMPDIDGFDDYTGKIVHTSRWDHDFDYTGKQIGVIGTGATALQAIPELAKNAAHLTVFQRTPIWVAPKPNFRIPAGVKTALDRLPGVRPAVRGLVSAGIDAALGGVALAYGRRPEPIDGVTRLLRGWTGVVVKDPEVAAKLTPQYTFGCKRPSVSNAYLQAFNRDNVTLTTDSITKVTPTGIVTADGTEYELDVIVCATGFKIMERGATPPFPVIGRDGLDLGEWWHENRFQAYQGVSIPRFPNLFFVTGPYAFAAGSYIAMIECTTRHIVRALAEAKRRGATAVEIKQEPHDRYWHKVLDAHDKALWLSGACDDSNTYYINYHGDGAVARPTTHLDMWWGNKHFPLNDYRYEARPARAAMTGDPR